MLLRIQDPGCAEAKGDTEMMTKIRDVDLIAAEAKYHEICKSQYVAKRNVSFKSYKEESNEDLFSDAFQDLMKEVEPGIYAGRAYTMTFLPTHFKSHLKKEDIAAENYHSRNLKIRLQNHFKDSVIFHQQPNPSKPEVIYSSQISLQDIINAVSTVSSQTSKVSEEKPTKSSSDFWLQILFHTAQIIKADLHKCTGIDIKLVNVENLNLRKAKQIIPQGLYWLLWWIVDRREPLSYNVADKRHIVTISQDVIHCASHGT